MGCGGWRRRSPWGSRAFPTIRADVPLQRSAGRRPTTGTKTPGLANCAALRAGAEGGSGTLLPVARCRWRSRSCRQHSACLHVSDHQPRSPRLYVKPSGDTRPLRLIVQPRHSGRSVPKSPRRNSRNSLTADHGTRCVPRSHARTADIEQPSRSAQALRLNRHDRRSSRNPSGGKCQTRRRGIP